MKRQSKLLFFTFLGIFAGAAILVADYQDSVIFERLEALKQAINDSIFTVQRKAPSAFDLIQGLDPFKKQIIAVKEKNGITKMEAEIVDLQKKLDALSLALYNTYSSQYQQINQQLRTAYQDIAPLMDELFEIKSKLLSKVKATAQSIRTIGQDINIRSKREQAPMNTIRAQIAVKQSAITEKLLSKAIDDEIAVIQEKLIAQENNLAGSLDTDLQLADKKQILKLQNTISHIQLMTNLIKDPASIINLQPSDILGL